MCNCLNSKCKKGYEVRACKSAAGYYVGTFDEDGFPQCRLTSRYSKTEAEVEKLILDRQSADENWFCNGNGRCFQ